MLLFASAAQPGSGTKGKTDGNPFDKFASNLSGVSSADCSIRWIMIALPPPLLAAGAALACFLVLSAGKDPTEDMPEHDERPADLLHRWRP